MHTRRKRARRSTAPDQLPAFHCPTFLPPPRDGAARRPAIAAPYRGTDYELINRRQAWSGWLMLLSGSVRHDHQNNNRIAASPISTPPHAPARIRIRAAAKVIRKAVAVLSNRS